MRRAILAPLLGVALAVMVISPVAAIDRDGDGLRDFFERKWGVTSAASADSDGDGVVDAAEDADGDRLSELGEQRYGTNPDDRDTDDDGKPDGVEESGHQGRTNALDQDRRPLPRRVKPTLAKAKLDYPPIRADCFARLRDSVARRCVLGDEQSETSVVLFGDSHALMWSPAFAAAAEQAGWRLVTFFKGGCPSVDVENKAQYELDRNQSCDAWRANVLAWIAAHPPDVVVLTNSDGYTMTRNGNVLEWAMGPAVWKQGLVRMLAELPASSDAVIFGDAPMNRVDPVDCLRSHSHDMSACASRRQGPSKRRFEVVEREAAQVSGAKFRTLYEYVCSYDPCPLVQGETLIWRDKGHLTRTFARRLAPTVQRVLTDVLAAP